MCTRAICLASLTVAGRIRTSVTSSTMTRHPGMAGCRVMVEDVTEVLIRPATVSDARQIARVHIASWREAYADVIADVYLAHLDVAAREEEWRAVLADLDRSTSVW